MKSGYGDASSVPEEMIEEILSRSPVKAVLRFGCVSKWWLSLIGSERFIKTHLRNSMENTDLSHHRVLFRNCGNKRWKQCRLMMDPDNTVMDSDNMVMFRSCGNKRWKQWRLMMDPDNPVMDSANMVLDWDEESFVELGCCNGLVCVMKIPQIRKYGGRFGSRSSIYVWNPSTGKSERLAEIVHPNSSTYVENGGLGWDEGSGEYKVFVNVRYMRELRAEVYSSKAKSWKKIKQRSRQLWQRDGQFVRGKLHWFTRSGSDIVSFDLEREVFATIKAPSPRFCHPLWNGLGVMGGCLVTLVCGGSHPRGNCIQVMCGGSHPRGNCIQVCGGSHPRGNCIQVWVMKKQSCWERVETHAHVLRLLLESPSPSPFVVAPDGDIWLFFGPYYLAYNPQLNKFHVNDTLYESQSYIQTLLQP